MEKACGLDVHKDSIFACILDEGGKKILENSQSDILQGKSRYYVPYRAFKSTVL